MKWEKIPKRCWSIINRFVLLSNPYRDINVLLLWGDCDISKPYIKTLRCLHFPFFLYFSTSGSFTAFNFFSGLCQTQLLQFQSETLPRWLFQSISLWHHAWAPLDNSWMAKIKIWLNTPSLLPSHSLSSTLTHCSGNIWQNNIKPLMHSNCDSP